MKRVGYGLSRRGRGMMHHGASVCLGLPRALASVFCGTTQKNNLEKSDAIFHVKKSTGYVQSTFSTFKTYTNLISLLRFRNNIS
jgi:hypothetical protein